MHNLGIGAAKCGEGRACIVITDSVGSVDSAGQPIWPQSASPSSCAELHSDVLMDLTYKVRTFLRGRF